MALFMAVSVFFLATRKLSYSTRLDAYDYVHIYKSAEDVPETGRPVAVSVATVRIIRSPSHALMPSWTAQDPATPTIGSIVEFSALLRFGVWADF